MAQAASAGAEAAPGRSTNDTLLFWGSFFAIVATAFGFVVRAQIIGEWETAFSLTGTQKGELLGVGLWPFAVSIILFSLVIDKIGYGKSMLFAFACHFASTIMLIFAKDYSMLYWGTFVVALGNGTVEAVTNPVVATMFPREKTKYLNILHAGWPGGQVLGGVLAILLGGLEGFGWKGKVALILLPTVAYGVMMLGRKFPVHERVEAGISYMQMLREAGWVPALVAVSLMVIEIGRFFGVPEIARYVTIAVIMLPYIAIVKSPGRPMFIFLVLLMVPLATTELGTDSWIVDLMTPVMNEIKINPGWILVYTSVIMMVLRFFAGSIVHRISPLGLLAASATIAAVGLFLLSSSAGVMILVAATIFAFGKTFFWPTTLGVVAEQFPKGGALTMNMIAGVGMLGVGIVGSAFMGNIQDRKTDAKLEKDAPALYAAVTESRDSVFGEYKAVIPEKVAAATAEDQEQIKHIQDGVKKSTLGVVAILPIIMLAGYLALILYFKSKGGYKAEELVAHGAEAKGEKVGV